jgi:toxin ParE1/3/4
VAPSSRLIWSQPATADLSDIWDYYANAASSRTADNIVRAIGDACRLIEDHPYGGRSRDEIQPGLRSVVAKPHVVFYRVGANGSAEVVRVIDGRRDIDAIFDETEDA